MRIRTTQLVIALLLAACSPARTDPIELPLAAVDGFSIGDRPAPIETAYGRYAGAAIAVEGIRLAPGLPAGLGSHPTVGLHEPPRPGEELRVLLAGSVPPDHGRRYRVIGRIVPLDSSYGIFVEEWTELPVEGSDRR